MWSALPDAVRRVKAIGYKIGLHTGGAYPERLKKILPDLDWVGFDVKAPTEKPEVYENVVRRKKVAEKVQESLDALLASGVSYEIRCTAHPEYLSNEDLLLITEELRKKGVKTFALQIYRQPPGVDKSLWLERVGSDLSVSRSIGSNAKCLPTLYPSEDIGAVYEVVIFSPVCLGNDCGGCMLLQSGSQYRVSFRCVKDQFFRGFRQGIAIHESQSRSCG